MDKAKRYAPEPWQPNEAFDWATGGRVLSTEELQILRTKLITEHQTDKYQLEEPA